MSGGSGYAEQAMSLNKLGYIAPLGIRERLQSQKDECIARLARVQSALDALDSNPSVAAALEAVMKAL